MTLQVGDRVLDAPRGVPRGTGPARGMVTDVGYYTGSEVTVLWDRAGERDHKQGDLMAITRTSTDAVKYKGKWRTRAEMLDNMLKTEWRGSTCTVRQGAVTVTHTKTGATMVLRGFGDWPDSSP